MRLSPLAPRLFGNRAQILTSTALLPIFRFAIVSAPPSFTTPPKILANLTSDAVPSSCASTITPACLQALYGIPTTSNAISTNILGVSGFSEQFANLADLQVHPRLFLANAFWGSRALRI